MNHLARSPVNTARGVGNRRGPRLDAPRETTKQKLIPPPASAT
jgi:hypothetical protein